jgi:hypothetical protein
MILLQELGCFFHSLEWGDYAKCDDPHPYENTEKSAEFF